MFEDLTTAEQCFLSSMAVERQNQIERWGEKQDIQLYPAILGEEFGEVCKAYLEDDRQHCIAELIQTATVCMAFAALLNDEINDKHNGKAASCGSKAARSA